MRWHVVNITNGDNQGSHQANSLNEFAFESKVEVIGFFTTKYQGIISHQGTYLHMHFRNKNGKVAGHVDDLKPLGNMKLYLPSLTQKKRKFSLF